MNGYGFAKFLIIFVSCFTANILIADERSTNEPSKNEPSTNEPSTNELAKWDLRENNSNHSDYLNYKLKYRGFITLFIWKELADIAFISDAKIEDFEGNQSCQLAMKLTTENHSFSESLHPYRYQWRSKVSPDLSKVYLVEEIGKGTNEEFNVHWLNWKDNVIDLFHQRQLIVPEEDVYAEEEEYNNSFTDVKDQTPEPFWEKDGKIPMPGYFNHLPNLGNSLDFLVHEKSIEFDQVSGLIDPLALIFSARWHNAINQNKSVFQVIHKDEIREYQIELLGEEILTVGEQEISTTKIYISRKNKQESEDEGFIALWVSNDAKRIPLKYEVEVRIGTIHVDLTEKSLQQYNQPKSCLASGAAPYQQAFD